MIVLQPDADGISRAVEALNNDEVVAYPTETVYGLAVNPTSETALANLFAAKQRHPNNPILLIIGSEAHLSQVTDRDLSAATPYMHAFWPGPLTLLLPKSRKLPTTLTGDAPKIAVRCPGCPTARALCDAFGAPITSTSANLSGSSPATNVQEINLPKIALAIDGGQLPPASPSTIFDPEKNAILRDGTITREDLDAYKEGR